MIIITEDKINELRIISNSATKLDMTPFVIYNGNVYLFNSKDSTIFIQEVTNFAYELYEKRVANIAMPDDYQDCWDLFEFDLSNSIKTIAGYFKITDGKTVANFYAKSNLDVRLSDEVKKFINDFKGVELLYFASENKTYTREEFINSFKQTFNKDVKLPKFLYHGTNSENIIGILNKGLTPIPDLSNFKYIKHGKHVFMSSSFNTAEDYARIAVSRKSLNITPIVLKIDSNKIDKNKITFDFDFYNANVGQGNKDYDEIIDKANLKSGSNQKHQDMANKNPGARFNKLGYNGTVYPGAIISLFTLEDGKYIEMSPQDYIAKYINPVENKTQKISGKVIITEEQLKALIEAETPNTMTFWHGGNLDNPDNDLSQKAGRFEYGPGLYLITKYDVAIKYAKGSRKLYKVDVETGNDLEYTGINADNVKEFIKTYIIPSKRNLVWNAMMKRINENNLIPGYIVNNVIINENAIKPGNTKFLRQFYVDNGIDYNIVNNPFGWGEKMLVLFNLKKIKNITKIGPKDKIDKYDLHEAVENYNCPILNLSNEIIQYIKQFNTDEELLRSGGIPIDMLDRLAFGFSDEDVKTLNPIQLKVKWKEDLDNVLWEIQKSGLSKKQWAQKINLNEPIDVSYEKNNFYIEDGHHRYVAAKILNKPLNVSLEIKQNPILSINKNISYDQLHRCVFKQIKNMNLHEDVNNVIYSAIFFDKDELVNKYKPVYPNVFAHHSTIEFRPKDISNLPLGENIEVKIKGRLITENVDVLLVENEFSKSEYPHITLSTNEDVQPYQSNEEIKNNLDKVKPLNDSIVGKFGYFDGHDKFN